MKNGLNKFTKGMFAIFTIKLIFFGTFFMIQSCNEDSSDIEISSAENSFIESLQISKNNFSNIKINKKSSIEGSLSKKGGIQEFGEITLVKTNPNQNLEIDNFNQVVDLINIGELEVSSEEILCEDKNTLCLSVEKEETKKALSPAINSAKNYLHKQGFNDSDIVEILKGENDSALVPLVQLMINSETGQVAYNSNDFVNLMLGVQTVNAQNWSKIGKCAKKVFGLDDLSEFRNWKNMKKGAQKKLLRRVAGKMVARYASAWIGVGLIVGEFALCMY